MPDNSKTTRHFESGETYDAWLADPNEGGRVRIVSVWGRGNSGRIRVTYYS